MKIKEDDRIVLVTYEIVMVVEANYIPVPKTRKCVPFLIFSCLDIFSFIFAPRSFY